MPRLIVAQRICVCNEFARVGNAHEVLKRWRNYWQNMKRKEKLEKPKNCDFVIHFVFFIT